MTGDAVGLFAFLASCYKSKLTLAGEKIHFSPFVDAESFLILSKTKTVARITLYCKAFLD